jgi:small subunit ribosomal protein S2
MREITLEELLEAGCHFGHQVTRYNPKAREFIFEARDNIHIIDLAKTKEGLEEAAAFVKSLAAKQGSSLIVVGTKRQAQTMVEEEVKRARTATAAQSTQPEIFDVTTRWLGGTLTNAGEVAKNYQKLKDLTARLKNDEEKEKYTKKEIGQWEKSRQKLQNLYGGVVEMKKVPDALFIVDTHMENLAVLEARKMGVPIVGIVDTNADPAVIDYPIPANDDAVGSLKLIIGHIMDAWIEGKTKGAEEPSTSAKPTADKKEKKAKKEEATESASIKTSMDKEEKPKKAAKKKE